eukprot:2006831-Pleurochrysis_carterae.AAC.1
MHRCFLCIFRLRQDHADDCALGRSPPELGRARPLPRRISMHGCRTDAAAGVCAPGRRDDRDAHRQGAGARKDGSTQIHA